MTIPRNGPLLPIALFVCAGLIVAGSILVWAAGEDDGAVALAVGLAFGGGAFGVLIDEGGRGALWGSMQIGVALVMAAMVAGEAPVSAGNAAFAVGAAISLFSVVSAVLIRIKSGTSSQQSGSLGD